MITSSSRLKETRKFLLAEQLLDRGARTPTVHKLTGVPEITIRHMHRELYGRGPTRGPSSYSYLWFTDNPKRQFVASLAAACLRQYIGERWNDEPGEFLGEAYIKSYDFFRENVRSWKHHSNEIEFERFASLGGFLAKRNPLDFMSCARCSFSFVGQIHPIDGIHQTICPACLIKQGRECAHCGTYVPLEFGDFPPQRAPSCISCACSQQRVSTLEFFIQSRSLYPSQKCQDLYEAAMNIVERVRLSSRSTDSPLSACFADGGPVALTLEDSP